MKKIFLLSAISISTLLVLFILFLHLSVYLFPELWGSYYLGSGLYMIEWDGGKIIVAEPVMDGNTCIGGISVIPENASDYNDEGMLSEQIIDVLPTDSLITVHTCLSGHLYYEYVIDKRLIVPGDSVSSWDSLAFSRKEYSFSR